MGIVRVTPRAPDFCRSVKSIVNTVVGQNISKTLVNFVVVSERLKGGGMLKENIVSRVSYYICRSLRVGGGEREVGGYYHY